MEENKQEENKVELKLVTYPSKQLKEKCVPIKEKEFSSTELKFLVEKMTELMIKEDGMGLAANQIDFSDKDDFGPVDIPRLFLLDKVLEKDLHGHLVFCNPTIVEKSGEIEINEGCLSFPNLSVKVKRASKITIEAFDENGAGFFLKDVEGLAAVAFQHELDHLDGITFLDHLSRLKRDIQERKFAKARKAAERAAKEAARTAKLQSQFGLSIGEAIRRASSKKSANSGQNTGIPNDTSGTGMAEKQ